MSSPQRFGTSPPKSSAISSALRRLSVKPLKWRVTERKDVSINPGLSEDGFDGDEDGEEGVNERFSEDKDFTCINSHPPHQNLLLPEDILCFIFVLATEDIFDAVQLSHVSHAWREITQRYGPLWGRIRTASVGKFCRQGGVDFLKRCFDLAQNAELCVDLDIGTCSRKYPKTTFDVLDILAHHAHQIAHLRIESSLDALVYFASKHPVLDPLRIKTWVWKPDFSRDYLSVPLTEANASLIGVGWPWEPLLSLGSASSNIRRLGFAWVAPPLDSPIWGHKSEIHLDQIDFVTFDDYIEVITRSPQLEIFKVRGLMTDGPHRRRDSISMDHLRVLSLMDVPFPGLSYFFNTISLPCLMELSIRPALPEIPDETIHTLLASPFIPLPLLKRITSVTMQSFGFAIAGELFEGYSNDKTAKIFISLVYRGGFSKEIRRKVLDLFPSLSELTMEYDGTCLFGVDIFEGSALVNLKKLIVLPERWILWVPGSERSTLPKLTEITITGCRIGIGDFTLINKLLCGGKKRVLILQDVKGISKTAARGLAISCGIDLVWRTTPADRGCWDKI